MSGEDRRIHARIETSLDCTVLGENGPAEGRILDLSPGGALLQAPKGIATVGQTLTLEIKSAVFAEGITVLGEVLRIAPIGKVPGIRDTQYGIRFALVEPKQRSDLGRLIETLAQERGVGKRKHPRIARRVQLTCTSAEQFQALMKNISHGGMAFTCRVPVVLEERVTVEVRMEAKSAPIELPGIVVHVRTVGEKEFHVGIKFLALSPEKERQLRQFIMDLLKGPLP